MLWLMIGQALLSNSIKTMFLIRCSIAKRINAIGVKHFRDAMADEWMGNVYNFDGQQWHTETLTKLEYYESTTVCYQRRWFNTNSVAQLRPCCVKAAIKNTSAYPIFIQVVWII
jgi:hypothetical protein